MGILDRYVINETLQVLVVGSLCVLGIFFGTVEFQHAMDMLNQFRMPMSTVLLVMLLQMPTGIIYCMPAAVLIATLFFMSRQQRDCEFLSLQVAGVPLKRVFVPYLAMSLIAASSVFFISEYVAPQTRHLSEKLLLLGIHKAEGLSGQSAVSIKDESGKVGLLLMFGSNIDRTIHGFVLLDITQKGLVKLIWAERGKLVDGKWQLNSGQLFELLRKDELGNGGRFEKMTLGSSAGITRALNSGPISTLEKTTSQLKQEIETCKKTGKAPPSLLVMQYYRRFSHPASCFLLVLAAVPIMVPRRRHSTNLIFCYGGVLVVLFFVMQQVCMSLSENQRLDPLLGAWLPCAVLLFFSLVVYLIQKSRA